jgi:hypothetical protein
MFVRREDWEVVDGMQDFTRRRTDLVDLGDLIEIE